MLKSTAEAAPPPPGTRCWSAQRKAAVVEAVRAGRLTPEAARRGYALSEEEFAAWERAFDRHGVGGLRLHQLRPRH